MWGQVIEILTSRPETEEIESRLKVGNDDNSTESLVGPVMWTASLWSTSSITERRCEHLNTCKEAGIAAVQLSDGTQGPQCVYYGHNYKFRHNFFVKLALYTNIVK